MGSPMPDTLGLFDEVGSLDSVPQAALDEAIAAVAFDGALAADLTVCCLIRMSETESKFFRTTTSWVSITNHSVRWPPIKTSTP